jgi:hypothetical protein
MPRSKRKHFDIATVAKGMQALPKSQVGQH